MIRRSAVGLILLISLACGGPASQPADEAANPLYVDPAARDFASNPALMKRVLAGPHDYLRSINVPFTREVCRRFGDTLVGAPYFNLHGDAHLEQYAVTDLGRGLTDFDDSSTGPAVVDLVRFGVSLQLACDARGWASWADAIYDDFLDGYRAALEDPEVERPLPTAARRLAAGFEYDRQKYLDWVASIVDPVPAAETTALVIALGPYVEVMLTRNPQLLPEYFQVVDVGYLRLGIGSALDRKYLVRIRGETEDPEDDLVLELKQVRNLSEIECISVARGTDPFRILIGQSRIAYQPYDLLGYVRFEGLTFWIHAWVDNHVEASIEDSFRTAKELAEVAYDVGVQLGRGHPNQIAEPLDLRLRREQLDLLDRDEKRIRTACKELAQQVRQAWQRFRAAAGDL